MAAAPAAGALRDLNAVKVASIMSYLDDVDRATSSERPRSPESESRPPSVALVRRSYPGSDLGAGTASVLSLAGRENVFHGIKNKIEALRVENAELKQQTERLKSRATDMEAEHEREKRRLRETLRDEMDSQRDASQRAVDEHLRCIRRLISDKESLSKAVQEMTAKLTTIESSHADELRRLESAHTQAVSETKGRLALQEKTKREQWTVKEAKRIKETTLKAMEPDIALLMNRHKAERRRMEEEHLEAMRRKDDQLLLKDRELAEAKLRLGKDIEELILRERSAVRGQITDESRRAERLFDDERQSIKAMHAVELRELNERVARLQADLASQQQAAATAAAAAEMHTKDARHAHEEAVERLRREHREELARAASAKEVTEAGFEAAVAARIQDALRERAAAIERRLAAERDQAVDAAIARLEDEQVRVMREHRTRERELETKLTGAERDRDRHAAESGTLRTTLDALRADLKHRDATIVELRGEIEQLKQRLRDLRQVNDDEVTERLRALDGAWRAKSSALENDHVAAVENHRIDVLKLQKAAERQQEELKAEYEAAERRHASELLALTERIQGTVLRKDAQIRLLQEQTQALEASLQLREMELERHTALLHEDN
jgi:hypothetical protein